MSAFTLEAGEILNYHHLIYPGETLIDKQKTVDYCIRHIHGLSTVTSLILIIFFLLFHFNFFLLLDQSYFSDADRDYEAIYHSICSFVKSKEKIILVKDGTCDKKCLSWLQKRANSPEKSGMP